MINTGMYTIVGQKPAWERLIGMKFSKPMINTGMYVIGEKIGLDKLLEVVPSTLPHPFENIPIEIFKEMESDEAMTLFSSDLKTEIITGRGESWRDGL